LNPRTNVLGVGISLINMQVALDRLSRWIEARDHQYVCVCTVNTVMQCHRNERLRRIVNAAGMATPDGMPLVWLSRLAGHRYVSRVYGPDLMLAEMAASQSSGHRHFLYGGREGVAERLASAMRARFPSAAIVGTLSPPMGTAEELCNEQTASLINQARPDIVWVGVSTPKQEAWMACMRPLLDAPVLVGVGAAFDFHTGRVAQAPHWIQQAGLEWLFRLAHEPRRLWRRYLLDNPRFLFELALQKLGVKRYDLG
jgi:N-acetylglucosaminyldiphosphoundecaprenol N-acetyl-beta-D-mannosaminyltransferase